MINKFDISELNIQDEMDGKLAPVGNWDILTSGDNRGLYLQISLKTRDDRKARKMAKFIMGILNAVLNTNPTILNKAIND